MVKNTNTWISWERNIIFLSNKKILNLHLRWHILRSYRFVEEVTLTLFFPMLYLYCIRIPQVVYKCNVGKKWFKMQTFWVISKIFNLHDLTDKHISWKKLSTWEFLNKSFNYWIMIQYFLWVDIVTSKRSHLFRSTGNV